MYIDDRIDLEPGVLVFGDINMSPPVAIISSTDDLIVENDESFTISLSSPDPNVNILTPEAQVVVLDNDGKLSSIEEMTNNICTCAVPGFGFSVASYFGTEAGQSVLVTIQIVNEVTLTEPAVVLLSTEALTATAMGKIH